jgi:hypothetical protein
LHTFWEKSNLFTYPYPHPNFSPNSLLELYFFHKHITFGAALLNCIDSAYADEFASVPKDLWGVLSKQTINSEIVSNVDTKDW